jgi:hypothetical protein
MDAPTVTVWIARSRTPDGPETTAWAHANGATGWIEHQATDDVTWTETSDGDRVAESVISQDPVGTVREAEVQDPVKLSEKFPDELLSPRFIDPDGEHENVID